MFNDVYSFIVRNIKRLNNEGSLAVAYLDVGMLIILYLLVTSETSNMFAFFLVFISV